MWIAAADSLTRAGAVLNTVNIIFLQSVLVA